MSRRWLHLAAAAVVLIAAGRVYAVDQWTFSTTWGGSLTEWDGGWRLTGADGGSGSNIASYTAVALEAATLTIVWEYGTTDGAFYDRPQFVLNGIPTDLLNGNTKQGTGSIQFDVQPGDVYGFQIWSIDSCCGAGWLTIGEPEPAATPSPSEEPSPSPTIPPSEPPSPEPTPEPTPEETPSPSPSLAPSPDPSPLATPEPSQPPLPSPVSPSPSPAPTPAPTPTKTPVPSPTPAPSLESPSVAPTPLPEPSTEPSPVIDLPLPDVGAAAAFVADLGHDISPAEKRRAAPIIVAAVVVTQVAQAAASAAAAAAASTPGGRKGRK